MEAAAATVLGQERVHSEWSRTAAWWLGTVRDTRTHLCSCSTYFKRLYYYHLSYSNVLFWGKLFHMLVGYMIIPRPRPHACRIASSISHRSNRSSEQLDKSCNWPQCWPRSQATHTEKVAWYPLFAHARTTSWFHEVSYTFVYAPLSLP